MEDEKLAIRSSVQGDASSVFIPSVPNEIKESNENKSEEVPTETKSIENTLEPKNLSNEEVEVKLEQPISSKVHEEASPLDETVMSSEKKLAKPDLKSFFS